MCYHVSEASGGNETSGQVIVPVGNRTCPSALRRWRRLLLPWSRLSPVPRGKPRGQRPHHPGGSHTKESCHTTIGSPAWVADESVPKQSLSFNVTDRLQSSHDIYPTSGTYNGFGCLEWFSCSQHRGAWVFECRVNPTQV